ncbi:fimbrial protein [Aeromonas caviae]|uniref:fimbrial protein n=1 Tax=Aeromonas caviae TaxID=648 RepID=UPI0029D52CBA|nr:fimbrial protein [Aeromonas caviae]MDX7871219.1 fimbrial protein [Aeromonas caviae]
MKNNLSNFALVGIFAASSILSSGAFASDGTITISGEITANSCKVAGSTSANGDVAVALDKIATTAIGAAGKTAGFKPFTITLSACDAAVTGAVKAGFEAGPTTDIATGRLNLIGTNGVATNVQLQLRNSDDTIIKVGDNSTVNGATVVASGAKLSYQVGYYANGVPTAGSANSNVTYSIIYL